MTPRPDTWPIGEAWPDPPDPPDPTGPLIDYEAICMAGPDTPIPVAVCPTCTDACHAPIYHPHPPPHRT